MRFNSPARSTDFSQLEIASAVSSPMLRTRSSADFEAARIFGASPKCSSSEPRAHRADVLDQVQRDEGFAGIHAELKRFKRRVSSSKWREIFAEADCSAVLAASIFHFGTCTVGGVKQFLANKNIPVRL